MKKIYFLVLIFFISCSKEKEQDIPVNLYNNSTVINIKNPDGKFKLSKIIKNIKYIQLDESLEGAIGEVAKIKVINDKIYILDEYSAKSLFCFDINGKFLFKIGRHGSGPGELINPKDFDVDDYRIEILDNHKQSFLIYDLEGNFIKEMHFNFAVHSYTKLDNIYLLSPGYQVWGYGYNYHLFIADENIKIKEKYFKIEKELENLDYFGEYQLFKSRNTILYKDTWDNYIYSFAKEKLYPKYKLDFENYNFDFDEIKKNKNKLAPYLFRTKVVGEIFNICDLKKYLYFSYIIENRKYDMFFDKKSNLSYSGLVENDIDGFPLYSSLCIYKDKIYGIINPMAIVNAAATKNYVYKTKKLVDYAKSINETSNYLIGIYTLIE